MLNVEFSLFFVISTLVLVYSTYVMFSINAFLFVCLCIVCGLWVGVGIWIIDETRTPRRTLYYMIRTNSSAVIIKWLNVTKYTADDLKITSFINLLTHVDVCRYIIEHDLFDKTARQAMQAELILHNGIDPHDEVFWTFFHKAPYSQNDIDRFIMKAIYALHTNILRGLIAQSTIKTNDEWLRTALETELHDILPVLLSQYDDPAKELRRLKKVDLAFSIAHARKKVNRWYALAYASYCPQKRLLPADTYCIIERDVIGKGATYKICANKYQGHPILHVHAMQLKSHTKCIVCKERMMDAVYINR